MGKRRLRTGYGNVIYSACGEYIVRHDLVRENAGLRRRFVYTKIIQQFTFLPY